MVYLRNSADFLSRNEIEIRKMVNRICTLYRVPEYYPDILQEFYVQFISRKILQKYDPQHPSATKISTYLYRAVENLIRVFKNSNEFQVEKHEVSLEFPFRNSSWKSEESQFHNYYFDDNQDAYCISPIRTKIDIENLNYRNHFSDSIDGMNFDLGLFKDFLRKKNRHYTLKKRKNRDHNGKNMNLLRVFQLMQYGFTNREIAREYGVSDMFITTVKREIKDLMANFGIIWSYRAERDKILAVAK
jgi:hypothetical protein